MSLLKLQSETLVVCNGRVPRSKTKILRRQMVVPRTGTAINGSHEPYGSAEDPSGADANSSIVQQSMFRSLIRDTSRDASVATGQIKLLSPNRVINFLVAIGHLYKRRGSRICKC